MQNKRKVFRKVSGWRRVYKALAISLLVALLAGLIPPPLARTVLPASVAELIEATPAQAAPLAQSGSQIGNLVWKDLNANGLQDAGEPGLPGVTVGLYDNSGNPVMCPQVSLANLALNQVATQSSTWLGGYEADKAVDGNSTSTSSMSITGYAAESWWHVDLGQSAEIRQVVIYARPDGSHDQTEQLYVQISDQPFASTSLATTLADPNVWSSSLQGVWAGASLTVLVPIYRGRYVRIQHSNTNYLSLGDVQVFGNPILPVTAITDPNGQYTFAGGNCVQANITYQVRIATAQSTLRGLNLTTQDVGGVTSNDPVADNTDSDAATVTISGTQYSRISPITAPASGANHSYDFGYIPVEIGDWVWKDVNANSLQDVGEPGIAGVMVELLDNSGNPVMCTDSGVYDTYRDNFMTGAVNNQSAGTLNWTTSWVQTNNVGVIGSSGNPDGSLQAYAGSTAYYSTRAVDLSVFATQPTLSFDYNMAGTASQFNIQYSINGGTSFTTLAVLSDNNSTYKSITYTLPSTITVATAQLRIRGQGTGTWAYFDNLTFRGQVNKAQTTVTDASGQYTFTGADCVAPSGSYGLRIANTQTALQGLFAASQNTGGVTSNDPVADNTDSDAATTTSGGIQYSLINPITAPAVGVNYSYDFGYVPVEIGNVVWKDLNVNGLQDGGEPGIAGVTVELLDSSGNAVICTEPGVYDTYRDEFTTGGVNNQSAGTLNWTTGWVQTNNVGVIGSSGNPGGSLQAYAGSTAYYSTRAVDLSGFASAPTLSFDYNMAGTASKFNIQYSVNGGTSFTTLAVLSDNNSTYKSIAYTLPSTVTVATAQIRIQGQGTGTWAYFDNVTFSGQIKNAQTDVTDAAGEYYFTGADCVAPSGSYRIRIANNQSALIGLFLTTQDAGGVTSNSATGDNTDSDAASVTTNGVQYAQINPITAPAAGVNYSYDFGYVPVEIGNYVWLDKNRDGLQDATDVPLADVTVELLDSSGNAVMCTEPGVYDTYRDEFTTGGVNNQSAGTLNWTTSWVQTNNVGVIGSSGNPGGSLQAYAGSTAYYSTRAVDLSGFASAPTLSFDYNMAGTASKFNILYSINGGTTFSTLAVLSDNNSTYKSIAYTLPSTVTVATAQIRIQGQGTGTWAYFDNVTLRGQIQNVQTDVTDATGFYAFTGADCVAPSGSYRIRIANNQAPLVGLFLTTQDAGGVTSNSATGDNTDSDAASVTTNGVQYAQINNASAPTAGVNYSYDFGYVPVEIGNYVWLDTNRDGLQDGTDTPLAGVTVELLNSSGNPVMCTDRGVYDRYRDEFSTTANTNSKGTLDWSNKAWVHTNSSIQASSGNPGGMLQVYGGSPAYYATRPVDLSVFAAAPTLSFDYNMRGVASKFNIQYSVNGGTSFTTLAVLSSNFNGYRSITYTLPSAVMVATAQIRIQGQGTGDWAYFDNVTLRGQIKYAQSTVTDANGQYTFTGVDCLDPSTSYRVRIPTMQNSLFGLVLTPQNAGGITTNTSVDDDSDSDASGLIINSAPYAVIDLTSPAVGANYSFDFGFVASPLGSLQVNKTINGAAAPAGWRFTLSSDNCALPPSLTNPVTTSTGSGGSVTFANLLVTSGTGAACQYQVSEKSQTGWFLNYVASNNLTQITLTPYFCAK